MLGWLEEKLPAEKNLPKELVAIVAPLYSCLEDRSGDVRKKAQAVVPLMMQHVGWDAMSKQANKLKVSFDLVMYSLRVNNSSKARQCFSVASGIGMCAGAGFHSLLERVALKAPFTKIRPG